MQERSIPPISAILPVLFNEETCIAFLFEKGILIRPFCCSICNGCMNRYGLRFRCTRDSCRRSISIFHGSFFSEGRLKCCETLYLGYLWLTNCSSGTMLEHTDHSPNTVSAYRQYFRELVANMLDTDDTVIGGPGVEVQVDETKFGKRKYHRGHRVEGAWVIVGVEKTAERRCFAEVVADRSSETIIDVLGRHLAQGSILCTDCWRGYSAVHERLGYEHHTVNHSLWFKDPNTGIDTNTVEGTNSALKRFIPVRNRTESSIPSFLFEFIWRRKYSGSLWASFIEALNDVAYIDN